MLKYEKKQLEERVLFDNLFGAQPYNLKLEFRDVFGMLSFLDNDNDFSFFDLDAENDIKLAGIFLECAPQVINNDQDILAWLHSIEKKSLRENFSISFEDFYPETIKAFKEAMFTTKQNQKRMSFAELEKIQDNEALVGFIYSGHYKNDNLALLPNHQIEIALRKRDEAISLLYEIEDMFGELKMQFTKRDENGRLVII